MSIKTYSYKKDGATFLSPHFQVKEFVSMSSNGKIYSDIVKIDTDLVDMLEKLYDILGCGNKGSIVINSGYRTPEHDRAVGGSGSGKHVDGVAADIVCRANGKIINAKIVCCVASELFGGVANISKRYEAVHVDTRIGSKYWGDEILGYSSIWKYNSKYTDFYKYFNITKDEVDKYRTDVKKKYNDGRDTVRIKTMGVCGNTPNIHKWSFIEDYQIRELQRILRSMHNIISVDSIAGPKTYQTVKKYTVGRGDRGELVKWVQNRLNRFGYNSGKADGIVGPKTLAAIDAFNNAHNIDSDKVTNATWYYLISAVIK